jgi:hypothetical protein
MVGDGGQEFVLSQRPICFFRIHSTRSIHSSCEEPSPIELTPAMITPNSSLLILLGTQPQPVWDLQLAFSSVMRATKSLTLAVTSTLSSEIASSRTSGTFMPSNSFSESRA